MAPGSERSGQELRDIQRWALRALEDIRVFKEAELRRLNST